MRTLWFGLVSTVAILLISPTAADVNLIIAHSNDLLFQIDEITANDKICNKIIPTITVTTTTQHTTSATNTTITVTTPVTLSTSAGTSTTQGDGTTNTGAETTQSTGSTGIGSSTINSGTTSVSTSTPTSSTTVGTTVSTAQNTSDTTSSNAFSAAALDSDLIRATLRRTERSTVTDGESAIGNSQEPQLPPRLPSSDAGPHEEPICYGGVARHLSKINELRQMNNDSIFIHLNAGGMLGGSVWFPILGVNPIVESMKEINYTAVGLGYRDFDEGITTASNYLRQLKERNIKVLCANVDTAGEPELTQLFDKYIIIKDHGLNIGIVGFIGTDADYLADTGGLKFTDEIDAIQKTIDVILNENVTFIIAIGSAGLERAKEIQRKCLAVDVIVSGGGKNVFLYNGQPPLNETSSGPYPFVYQGTVSQLLVQSSRYGKYLGVLNLTVNDKGQITSWKNSNPVLLNNDPDPILSNKVDEWRWQVKQLSDVVIGRTKVPIVTDRHVCWYKECNGGNLVADAVFWYLTTNITINETWGNSVAAVVWHSGALSATDLGVNPGPITFGDILAMCPYANTLAIADMTGENITTLFEKSFEFYNDTSVANLGEFLHFSGLRIQVDITKPKGSRVVEIKIRDTTKPSGDWSPLQPREKYRIGMPSFIARGGSRFVFMEKISHTDTRTKDEEAMKLFIQATSPFSNGVEGRLTFVRIAPKPGPCNTDVTGTVFLTIFLTLLVVGSIYVLYKFIYPRIRERRGSLLSLIR